MAHRSTILGISIKIGAKVMPAARYVVFQMAEVAVPRSPPPSLFRTILDRIHRLRPVRPAKAASG